MILEQDLPYIQESTGLIVVDEDGEPTDGAISVMHVVTQMWKELEKARLTIRSQEIVLPSLALLLALAPALAPALAFAQEPETEISYLLPVYRYRIGWEPAANADRYILERDEEVVYTGIETATPFWFEEGPYAPQHKWNVIACRGKVCTSVAVTLKPVIQFQEGPFGIGDVHWWVSGASEIWGRCIGGIQVEPCEETP